MTIEPMTLKLAKLVTGHRSGLGKPSKMPGPSTSLPAQACNVGAKLAKVPGSVCAKCYALRGHYTAPSVRQGLARRLAALSHPRWVEGMTYLIERATGGRGWFRWFDSGDIQSPEHLRNIAEVARNVPDVDMWLPSKESTVVRQVMAEMGDDWPPNLTVRLSAPMVGGAPPRAWKGLLTSTVDAVNPPEGTVRCEAKARGNFCGPCRACWDPNVANVDYPAH